MKDIKKHLDSLKGVKVDGVLSTGLGKAYRWVEKMEWVEVCSFYGVKKCGEYGLKQLRELVRDNSCGKCDLVNGEFVSLSSEWMIEEKFGVLSIWHGKEGGYWEEFDDLYGA